MKKLGFGLMRLPLIVATDDKTIDISKTKEMVDMFIDRGFTYFDTAWLYHAFESEKATKKFLTSRYPREAYTLATKLHCSVVKSFEDRDNIFNEQLKNIGVDFFDYYLIHDLGREHLKIYEEFDCFNWLREKKKAGLVKKIGFSFHDTAELLDEVLTKYPDMDFVQLQINYLDWESDTIQSKKCYEVARKHNKPIIVMEPVKGGTLANVSDTVKDMFKNIHPDWSPASWALKFAAGLEGVIMVLSGMSNLAQLDDNTAFMADAKPLNQEELMAVRTAADMINGNVSVACTGCSYCTEGCPMNIAIPKYFALYNEDKREVLHASREWTAQQDYYENLTMSFGAAGDCIGCGACETACPQHLPVIKHLKEVKNHFGK